MDYKKIIRSRSARTKILALLNFIPDKLMLKVQYYIKMNKILNIKQPRKFTEKLQWYKLYYRNPLMVQCVDKYTVREYVKSKGLEHILNDLYGVYDKVDDINFGKLPNEFVIKTTNGGGGINIIICDDKKKFDIEENKRKLEKWMSLGSKRKSSGREWAYYGLKPKIIIERYLKNYENPKAGIPDYKFFCFNGKPEFIVLDVDRYIDHRRNFYDKNWVFLDVDSDCPNIGDVVPKPEGLEEMLSVASRLSEEFPYVRVDLYYIDNKVYFGELTFYPWSGYVQFNPEKFDYTLGEHFVLPN